MNGPQDLGYKSLLWAKGANRTTQKPNKYDRALISLAIDQRGAYDRGRANQYTVH